MSSGQTGPSGSYAGLEVGKWSAEDSGSVAVAQGETWAAAKVSTQDRF